MKKYYKIDLVGSTFWQNDSLSHTGYKNCTFTKRDEECLNNVFFGCFPNGVLHEVTTGNILIMDNDLVVNYPKGVSLGKNIEKSNSLEVKRHLEEIKSKGLEKEYLTIVEELLEKSHQCELVCERKKLLEK